MVHVDLYLKGERRYAEIVGPTGPLVCVLNLDTLVPSSKTHGHQDILLGMFTFIIFCITSPTVVATLD